MGRPSRAVDPAPDPRIGPTYWLSFGADAHPTVRDRLVYLTVEELCKAGPGDFSAKDVCDRLGVKYPMINYYFGSRDALIAEAVAYEYGRTVQSLKVTLDGAPRDPEKRVLAWIEHDVENAIRHRGLGVLLQYPIISSGSTEFLGADPIHSRLRELFEFYLAMVTLLLGDLRDGQVSDIDFDADSVPRQKLLSDPAVTPDAASAVWALHGLVLWSTGTHLVLSRGPDPGFDVERARRRHIDNILSIARGR